MDMMLDIETYARRTKELEAYHDGKQPERRTAPKNYKDPVKVAAWNKAEDQRHGDELAAWAEAREDAIRGAALVPTECGIACIGYSVGYEPAKVLEGHESEKKMLKALQELVVEEEVRRVIGYNVVFDMSCIAAAAVRHGLWDLAGWIARVPYPESQQVHNAEHLDLMPYAQAIVGMSKGTKRPVTHGGGMKDVCRLLRIECHENDIDGSDVPKAWEAGDFETVYEHCKVDIVRTQKLALKLKSAFDLTV